MPQSLDLTLVFFAAFGAALSLQAGIAAWRVRTAGWTEATTVEVLEFAVSIGFITLSSIIGLLLCRSELSLAGTSALGLGLVLPLVWLTRRCFARLEQRKAMLIIGAN
ncbi:MAG: hypothetical protein ACT4N2_03095 [Hyphomicrobium sp.]